MKIKKILLFFWDKFYDIRLALHYCLAYKREKHLVKKRGTPNVMTIEETIKNIIDNRISMSRFGDGEIKLAIGRDISFQTGEQELAEKLQQVLSSDEKGHMVCIPDTFGDLSKYTKGVQDFWKKHLADYRAAWYRFFHMKKVYGNAFISRCYLFYEDKSRCNMWFEGLKKIWAEKDLLIVEGVKTRLGIGNDLFDNAKSIERILGPSEQAFKKYQELYQEILRHADDKLVLLAMGPAATLLAYDLSKEGIWALDVGHIDIEYEWYLTKAVDKVPVKNKLVYECLRPGIPLELDDEAYQKQIVARIYD